VVLVGDVGGDVFEASVSIEHAAEFQGTAFS
jgi:hypothetical protein